MNLYSGQITRLIEELSKLPGIGAKSAGRLAFHIMNMPVEQVEGLSKAIMDARTNVVYCKCPKIVHYNHGWRLLVHGANLSLTAYGKTWALTKEELL